MTRKFFISASVAIFMLCSCSSQEQTQEHDPEYYIPSPRELVENNTYIELPGPSLKKNILIDSLTVEETIYDNKLRAALYRFYKHVKLEDGYFKCDLKSGEEINISQELFERFIKNHVDGFNKWIDEVHSQGRKARVEDITEEYLECLLDKRVYVRGEGVEV